MKIGNWAIELGTMGGDYAAQLGIMYTYRPADECSHKGFDISIGLIFSTVYLEVYRITEG